MKYVWEELMRVEESRGNASAYIYAVNKFHTTHRHFSACTCKWAVRRGTLFKFYRQFMCCLLVPVALKQADLGLLTMPPCRLQQQLHWRLVCGNIDTGGVLQGTEKARRSSALLWRHPWKVYHVHCMRTAGENCIILKCRVGLRCVCTLG